MVLPMAAIPRRKSLHRQVRQVRQVSESMSGVVWDHAAKSADSGYHLIFGASKNSQRNSYRSQHMGTIQIMQPNHWGSLGMSTYFNHRYILLTAMMMEYRDPSIGHKMAQVILKTSMISYDTSMIL